MFDEETPFIERPSLSLVFSTIDRLTKRSFSYVIDIELSLEDQIFPIDYFRQLVFYVKEHIDGNEILHFENMDLKVNKKFRINHKAQIDWLDEHNIRSAYGYYFDNETITARFYFINKNDAAYFKLVWT